MRHSLCNKSSEVRKPGTQEHLRSYRREKTRQNKNRAMETQEKVHFTL